MNEENVPTGLSNCLTIPLSERPHSPVEIAQLIKIAIKTMTLGQIADLVGIKDKNFIKDLNNRTADQDIKNLIILVDNIDLKTMANGPSLASTIKIEREISIRIIPLS